MLSKSRSFQMSYPGVLCIALIVRIAWDLLVRVYPVSDSEAYDLLARNLANGNGYLFVKGEFSAHWAVGTSFDYSLLYRIFGMSYIPIVIFNLVISLATIWMTMRLAEKWFGRDVAIYSGYLLALWPNQIEFGSVLASELLFSFILMGWLAANEFLRTNPLVKGSLLGLIGAAASFVRPTALLIPLLTCGIGLVGTPRRAASRTIVQTLTVYIVMLGVIAPWSARNYRVFGRFVLISTNGGENFWEGNNPTGNGETEAFPSSMDNMNEAVRDNELGDIAKAYIIHYPGRFVIRTIKKVFMLNSHETIGVYWNVKGIADRFGSRAFLMLRLVNDGYWLVCLCLGVVGELVLIRRIGIWSALTHPVSIMWSYFTVVHAVVVVQDRYHMPSVPFIAVLAGLVLVNAGKGSVNSQAKGWIHRGRAAAAG